MKILGIFDNGGKTIDRYTVVTDSHAMPDLMEMLGCDDQGGATYSQWTTGEYDLNDDWKNRHLGKRIKFESLNEKTQKHIAERVFAE